jgi:putative membrane protein insertion efficiency factor
MFDKFMKKIALQLITIYQKTISPDHGPLSSMIKGQTCRFYPTCSEYTHTSIERYGILRGCWMGIKRISRCHPWNDGGYDPVPNSEIKLKKEEIFCQKSKTKN